MVSEGSCDTEDCSNGVENTDLITGINYILKYIQIENVYFYSNNISQYYSFYCIFYQINAALVSKIIFLLKTLMPHFLFKFFL